MPAPIWVGVGGRTVTGGVPKGLAHDSLVAYAPRLALDWLANSPDTEHRVLEGTGVFVDVSGFTALTERLSTRGRIGAEQISDVIATAFGTLLNIAGRFGADLLKWGGDAALLWFPGPDATPTAVRASSLMTEAMQRIGRVAAPGGAVRLQVSIGIHTGRYDFYLVGIAHRELIITGDAITELLAMESAASGGEIVASESTATLLPSSVRGGSKGAGILIVGPTDVLDGALSAPLAADKQHFAGRAAELLPAPTRQRLLEGGESAEHRQAAIAFVGIDGLGKLAERVGSSVVTRVLAALVDEAERTAIRHGVSFHGTDIASDGTKIILLGGVPASVGEDTDRLVRAARDIVESPAARAGLDIRVGCNAGRTFVFDGAIGPGHRRIYSLVGDAVNLAARIMSVSHPGEVLVTTEVVERTRAAFELTALEPVRVKGKAEPVATFRVGVDGSATSTPELQPAFVGRVDELAKLMDAADRSAKGAGATVEISGEPGIGKSRLVAEAAREWPLATWAMKGEAYDKAQPYSGFRRFLRSILEIPIAAEPSTAGDQLRKIVEGAVPDLLPWLPLIANVVDARVASTGEVDALDPRFRVARLESSTIQLLEMLIPEPAAFVFEDVVSLDAASSALVRSLQEATSRRPWLVVIVGASRRSEEPTLGTEVISLGPLDRTAARRLVVELGVATNSLAPSDLDALVARGAGNALFLRELAETARITGSIDGLPDSLDLLLAAQVDALEVDDRRVLRAAAVLGSYVDEALLVAVVDDNVVVDESVWRRLASFIDGEPGNRRFIHALVRDAAYEGLAFRRRRELHRRAAAAIESDQGEGASAELLSLHWLEAEDFARAWRYARVAGERSASLYANEEASLCFRRAIRAGSKLRPRRSAELATVAEALGDVSELAGSYEQARAAYASARRLTTLPLDQARLLRKNGVLHERSGHYSPALRSYALGLKLVRDGGIDVEIERCELELAYAGVLFRRGRSAKSAQLALQVADQAERLGYRRGLAHALYLAHIASVVIGDSRDDLGRRAVTIFEEIHDLVGQGNALNNLGIGAYFRGDWEIALSHYRASSDVRDRCGDVVGAATEDNNIGEILSDQGHLAQARPLFEAARETWTLARYRIGVALATANLGRVAVREGELETASHLLNSALTSFQEIGATAYVLDTQVRLLELDVALSNPSARATARMLISELASRPDTALLCSTAHRLLGVLLARDGDVEGADEELGRALVIAQARGATYEIAAIFEARAELKGDLTDRRRAGELWDLLGVTERESRMFQTK